MPVVFVNMRAGKSVEVKRKLTAEITDAIVRNVEVPKEKVTVFINERSTENICSGGTLACDN